MKYASVITLFKENGSWMALNTDPKVKALFGTDTLPTAFTDNAKSWDVYNEISRLNPNSYVVINQ